jgi:uncharacterized protein
MFAKRTVPVLVIGAALLAVPPAYAAETVPASPAASTAAASPASQTPADQILDVMGIKRALELTVPKMMTELEQNVTTTRPEIRDSLRQTLQAIKPDYDKSALDTYNQAKATLASMMSEKELADVAGFFSSPTGKKYLETEPQFLQKFSATMDSWRQQVSTDIVTRARAEMKKKGVDF